MKSGTFFMYVNPITKVQFSFNFLNFETVFPIKCWMLIQKWGIQIRFYACYFAGVM